MTSAAPVLPFAAFLGNIRRECGWDGFSFAEVFDRADQEIPLHTHREAHFFLLLKGSYVTSARGGDPVCTPSSLMFLPRWTTHRDHFQVRGGSFFTMSIQPEMLGPLTDGQRLIEDATRIHSAECKTYAYRIFSEFRTADECSPAVMEGLTLELLAWAARVSAPPAKQPPKWLRGVREQIHDLCTERVTVRELARTAGVHPVHFAKTFRSFHHCSPGEYMRRCRVERASALLSSTRRPLADVALECGFSDQSQFTKTFGRYAGMTPAEFRQTFGRWSDRSGNLSF